MSGPRILGISAYYHDSAAALLVDGKLVAAAQEERFTRKRHDSDFPLRATAYCLAEAGLKPAELDHVVFYDKPLLKFERLLETYLSTVPRGLRSFAKAMPVWLGEKLFQKREIVEAMAKLDDKVDWKKRLLFAEHHLSHAASAFYPSPFARAATLTMDGVGEWTTTSSGTGDGANVQLERELHFPHSIGLLYSALTYWLGFKVNSAEYKVMGLAPYGEPKYTKLFYDHLIDLAPDGTVWLDQSYFNYATGLTMTNRKFDELFGGPRRDPEKWLEQRHMDIAASLQAVTEEAVLRLARSVRKETGLTNLCLAGGVALNCVANGKVLRDGAFENIWIQPASGDAGGAVGAAFLAHHLLLGNLRTVGKGAGGDAMSGAYLGPSFNDEEVARRLDASGAIFDRLDEPALLKRTAEALAAGKVVGWCQGRMEFGPRALGARSILGDARNPEMQKVLNLKVKFRESFRPFAPAVLAEAAKEWFGIDCPSPYMLLVSDVDPAKRLPPAEGDEKLQGTDRLKSRRSLIPAVTHVDHSARVQTIHSDTNPRFHGLVSMFRDLTGCPVVVNTSFNIRGEPIVCTPEEAFRCFMATEIDVLVFGDCYMDKTEQPPELKLDYRDRTELD
jgi:carbamoyltransferase